jgi:Beta-propeller repeat/Divergent InlB B-repeat domain
MIVKRPVYKLGSSLLSALTICVLFAVCVPASSLDKASATGTRSGSPSQQPSTAAKQRAMVAFGNLPLTFEPNQGQTDAQVKYLSRGHGYNLFLTSKEAVFTLPIESNSGLLDLAKQKQMIPSGEAQRATAPSDPTSAVVRMTLLGANPQPVITAEDQLPGKTNYFIGNDPKNWHTGIPGFARVHYRDVYPGVDVVYHGAAQLEFDVVVNPGANPNKVELSFDGAKSMTTDNSGDLVLTSEAGEVRLQHPVAYQEKNGVRLPVDAHFVMKNAKQVVFALGSYDRSRQLVIDPPISVSYATYLGGGSNGTTPNSGQEAATGINVDSAGNAYVTGGTQSTTFPDCSSSCGLTGKLLLAYITQITAAGTLGYTTIFGGKAGNVFDQAIAINTNYLYIAGGTSSTDLPMAVNTYNGGATDGFVAKLGLDGTPIWATYIGGTAGDEAFGISLDSSGNAYVAGQTTSTDLKVVKALPQGGSYNGAGDAFVAEVDSGGQISILSYIGGSGLDLATGVSWNATTGNVSVGGSTQSTNLPVTATAFQKICGTDGTCNLNTQPPKGQPKDDAFVATFNPTNTSQYVFLTYVGGEFFDDSTAITTDVAGNVYITGQTQSKSFPVSNTLPGQGSLKGVQNAFVTVLNPSGTALVYSTYLGGNGFDRGLGIVVDSNNDAYVTGSTSSTNFPTQDPSQQSFGGGDTNLIDTDAFVSELNWDPNTTTLSLIFSTYLGGSGDEDIFGGFISIDKNENIYVIGDTNSINFPVKAPSNGQVIDASLNGGQLAKAQCSAKNRQGTLTAITCTDSFVAMYGSNTEEIVVTYTGTGTGTIMSYPAAMNCAGNPCSGNFPTATTVTLTAKADPNSVFNGWSGDNCSGTGTCIVTLNSNQFVSAKFTQTAANVVVTLVGSGTVTSSPGGINCPGTCTAAFSLGTKVTLTQTPASKITFTGWSGSCSGTGTCATTVNANEAVTATFQGFDITATALSPSSIQPGSSATSTATITGSGGFNTGSVTLACSITPVVSPAPTCKFGAISGGKSTLTVSTTGPSSSLTPSPFQRSRLFYAMFLPIGGIAFLGAGFAGKSRKKKLLGFVLVCLVVSGLIFLAACGSGSSQGGGGGGGGNAGTPAGTYTVSVTGTATGFVEGGNPPQLTLIVQ